MNQGQLAATVALLLFSVVSTSAHAASTYDRVRAERYIAAGERAWSSSNPNEPAVVKRIIADDFVWLLDGKVLGKSDAIAEAKPSKTSSIEHFDYLHIRFFGDSAVAQGKQTVIRRNGERIRNLFMDTWVLRGGKWQIVAATDVDIKE